MTYEEKFVIVVKAIKEAKKMTPSGYNTKLKITYENKLQDLDLDDISFILYQLQNDHKVIKMVSTANAKFLTGLDPWSEEQDYYALDALDSFDKWSEDYLSKTPSEKAFYSFDKESGILTIKGNNIRFKDEGRRIPYLDLLIKSSNYVFHSEAAEELEGVNQIREPKNTYYEVCRGIKARLLESGITDFLEFNFNRARINPLYKREPKQTS